MLDKKNLGSFTPTKAFIGIGAVLAFMLLSVFSGQIVETNTAGQFQIKQAAISGEMSVKMDPGLYFQNFGSVWTYKNVATVGFGEEKGEGHADIEAIPVIFNDGSKAAITGLVRVKLPRDPEKVLNLKSEYSQGYEHFIQSGIVPIVRNAVKLSANLRSAQDAYTTLAIFQQAVEDQLKNGPYLTKSDTVRIKKSTGDTEVVKVTSIVYDEKTGKPKRLNNRFHELGCDITEVVIDVPKFDPKVEEMIARRKDEAMKTELAKQSALRAKQDAITAAEQGKADVAKAKAAALVVKEKAVVEAQQAKEVAELQAQKKFEVEKFAAREALERAKKIRAEGAAKAAANAALVKAGLTPKERAEYDMKTAIGVAQALASVKLPESMIIGGTGAGGDGGSTAMTAVGYEAMQKLVKNMTTKKK